MLFGLTEKELGIVKNILKQNIGNEPIEAFIFGSRSTGKIKRHSDIDIALFHKNKRDVDFNQIMTMSADFTESDLPYKVDIIDFYAIDEHFRKMIEADLKKIDL